MIQPGIKHQKTRTLLIHRNRPTSLQSPVTFGICHQRLQGMGDTHLQGSTLRKGHHLGSELYVATLGGTRKTTKKNWLVVFSHPYLKNMLIKLEIFPQIGVKIKIKMKPAPRKCLETHNEKNHSEGKGVVFTGFAVNRKTLTLQSYYLKS